MTTVLAFILGFSCAAAPLLFLLGQSFSLIAFWRKEARDNLQAWRASNRSLAEAMGVDYDKLGRTAEADEEGCNSRRGEA